MSGTLADYRLKRHLGGAGRATVCCIHGYFKTQSAALCYRKE